MVKGWSKCQQCAPLSLHLHLPRLSSSRLPPSYPEKPQETRHLFQLCPQPSCLPQLPSPFSLGWQLPRSDSAYITKAQTAPLTPLASKRVGIGVKGPWGSGECGPHSLGHIPLMGTTYSFNHTAQPTRRVFRVSGL